jgi:hypothetical protein
MITYFLWGLLFTFIFDVILRGGEHELNNWERLILLILWPFLLIWFIYNTIKTFRNNK